MRQRTSAIWKLGPEKFKQLVISNNYYGHILKFFGLKNHGNNCHTLKRRIKEEGVDDTHIKNHIKFHLNQGIHGKSLEEILVENSTCTNRKSLKRRLISAGLLKNKCAICDLPPIWKDKKLILVLDHKNGINSDYRLENLRLVCPNCNSQTDTFCGRTKKRVFNCISCGRELKGEGKTGLCHGCLLKRNNISVPRKFEIKKEDLEKLVWEKPMIQIGKDFNVSGNAIKKRCRLMGISVPSRGYWTKKLYGKI
jgi:Zn finger protein HypA/HybF involved in hydrogenase expression